jgi:hypothetical protein
MLLCNLAAYQDTALIFIQRLKALIRNLLPSRLLGKVALRDRDLQLGWICILGYQVSGATTKDHILGWPAAPEVFSRLGKNLVRVLRRLAVDANKVPSRVDAGLSARNPASLDDGAEFAP